MVWKSILLLLNFINFSASQNVRSMMMKILANSKFQCLNSTCQPFDIITTSNVFTCQLACLTEEKCRTVNFIELSNRCELFAEAPSTCGFLLPDLNTQAMVLISGTRIPSGE